MFKILNKFASIALVLMLAVPLVGGKPQFAQATSCITGSLPNNLVNGSTADATQVMANYNFIISAVNAGCLAAANNLSDVANTAVALSNLGGLGLSGGNLTGSLNFAKATDVASAATTNIGAAAGNYMNVTGTTTITAFDTVQAGTMKIVNFTGVLTLTYNATSLILPGAANITTAAGDVAVFVSLGSGNWTCVSYQRASGTDVLDPLTVAHGGTGQTGFAAHQGLVATGATTIAGKTIPDCTDTSGNHLNYTQSTDAYSCGTSSSGAGAIKTVKTQTFTSAGTYTPDAGMAFVEVICTGNGGGGAGIAAGASAAAGGGGGGSGGTSWVLLTSAQIGASKAVTFGATGTGGASGANDGTSGGDVALGTLCVGKGGTGGSHTQGTGGNTPGGAGGVAGTGDVVAVGSAGGNGISGNGSFGKGGDGAPSFWGGSVDGPWNTSNTPNNGAAGNNYGAGGAGGSTFNSTNASGGTGKTGIVYIIEFLTQ